MATEMIDVEAKLAELLELGIGCPRAVEIRGPVAVDDWASQHLERLALERRLADCAERGIFCPPEVAKDGPAAVSDWLDEHDLAGRHDAMLEALEPTTRDELLELLEDVDPIEGLENIVNQGAELLARMRAETEEGKDASELLVELVSSLPAPGGFLVWAREIMAEAAPSSQAPERPRVPERPPAAPPPAAKPATPAKRSTPAKRVTAPKRRAVYQCQGSTKKGKRCQRTVGPGAKFCPTHAKAGKVHKPRV